MGQNASTTQGLATTTTTESSPTTIKPPDEPPEKTYKRDHQLISEGRVFTRYYIRKGVPSRSEVLVSYHKETKSICWSCPDSIRYDPLHSMKVKDISKVLHGKHTAAFQTPLAVDAADRFCFSIVSTKLHRSIDLEASEETTAAEFARAVDHIMEHSKAARARWSLPAPPYQMPITQASLSRCLNASLIQYNPKLKGQLRTGLRKSRSKKGGKKLSSGDVRQSRVKQSTSTQLGNRPRVGSKRKTKCSPVIASQSRVVLADCPPEFDTLQ
jgi:hypothetical protein